MHGQDNGWVTFCDQEGSSSKPSRLTAILRSSMAFFYPQCKPPKNRCPFVARFTGIWVHLGGVPAKGRNTEKSGESPEILIFKGIKEVGPVGLEPTTKGL
jgi:hypothetical protein